MTGRNHRLDAALRPQPKRLGADVWPTPPSLISALVRYVLPTLVDGCIWECASGDGRLADAMRKTGRQVVISDVRSNGVDFLLDDPPVSGPFASIITNPPFNQLDAFIKRGLQLLDRGTTHSLVLLARNDALMTSGRVNVLNRAAFILKCNWRARWIPNSIGQPRWAFSWVVWQADRSGPPVALHVQQPVAT